MADSASESSNNSNTLGLRYISGSLFSIPGFLVGLSTKGSSESDSVRSPTSPLDFRVFTNLGNPFSARSPRSSSRNGRQKKWDCSKVGLCIVKLLADENEPNGKDIGLPKRRNIIFGPQVKVKMPNSLGRYNDSLDSSMKSNSLPRSYEISPPSSTKSPSPELGDSNVVFGNDGIPLEHELFKVSASSSLDSSRLSSSLTNSTQNHGLSSKNFCLLDRTTIMSTSPVEIGRCSQVDGSLAIRPCSLPVTIVSGNGCVGPLSAREIERSEDYTCIISHGPNPKTTHIFGDCILECHTNELSDFDTKEEQEMRSPKTAVPLEGSSPCPSDAFLIFCYSCKRKLEKDEDIYEYRGEKAFCSSECHSDEIFFEEETENNCENCPKRLPASSYHEDLFLMGMPFTT